MEKILKADLHSWQFVRRHPIFEGIEDDQLVKALPYFRVVASQSGQILMEEGLDSGTDLYLILQGKLEVIRKTDTNPPIDGSELPEHFVIAQLQAGDSIGELSFIKGERRSASVRSLTESVLLRLSPIDLLTLEGEHPGISSRMMKNMVGYVGDRLKRTSDNEVRALKLELQNSIEKSKSNLFFSYVICLLCAYNVTLKIMANYSTDANGTSMVSAVIAVVFGVTLYFMTKQSKLPLANYGITTRGWKPALKESLGWSAVIIMALVIIKWILVLTVDKYQGRPVFDFDMSKQYLLFNFFLYGLHCPIQEFIARGVLQSSLSRFFTGKNVNMRAVLVSNALFSATHIHVAGGLLPVIVFVPGLFWGWLYSKHSNLVGVSISHLLVGWTALFFLNLEGLL